VVLRSSLVNEFSFGDRKSHPQVSPLSLDDAEIVLKSADIRTYKLRADGDGEVIDIRNRQTLGIDGWRLAILSTKRRGEIGEP